MPQILGVLPFVSQVLGWTYTSLWSLSFYPQPILNYRRLSTVGTTIDFSLLNLLGYFTYLIYNATFYFSSQVRSQYAMKNNGLMPTVQLNDIAYSIHALILSSITYSQFLFSSWWGFKESRRTLGARHTKVGWIPFGVCLLGIFAFGIYVVVKHLQDPLGHWAVLDFIYAVSYVKLFVTFFKYIPQVRINYTNKSTKGFAMDQILLDLSGGVASILQLAVDSYCQGDWSGVTGNPTKLLLGNFTILFDAIFLTQHYCLYIDNNDLSMEVQESLLHGREDV